MLFSQRKWLNAYHDRCLKEVGEAMLRDQRQNTEAYEWVKERTYPIPEEPVFSGASTLLAPFSALLVLAQVVMVVR